MTTEILGTAKGSEVPWIPTADTFAARLALVRQHMGWGNVAEAANECALPVASWRNWERDGRAPRQIVEISRKIAAKSGCDFMWLLTGSDTSTKESGTPTMRYRTKTRKPQVSPRASTRAGTHGHSTRPGGHAHNTGPASYPHLARRPEMIAYTGS